MLKVMFIPIPLLARLAKSLALVCVLGVLTSGLSSSRIPTALERIQASGKLVVISRNGPTTYYETADGFSGFEYVLTKKFADYLGVELEIRETENLALMLEQVGSQHGDLAASGLTVTEKRKKKVTFGEPYLQISQQLIYKSDQPKPSTVEDLVGKNILVIRASSHAERLRALQRSHPQLTWTERSDVEMLDLLEMVQNGKIDYAVVDSNAYEINKALYPKAQVAFNLSEPEDMAWAFKTQNDKSLVQEAQKFFKAIKQQGVIDEAMDTFYGHLNEINYSGAILFAHRLETRLPKWEDKLQTAAEKYELDWKLLAALSYQESHWNPKAKSPTGVRGFMMLTLDTAKFVGIENRLNAQQSIEGGAKYFRSIYNRIAQRVEEPDRTWFALAAYNVGLGHLEDARVLTEKHGKNPNKWTDVRETLPLLAKRKYYKTTKHGYSRGWEAVDYVQNIRNYHTIISWNEVEKDRLQQLAMTETQKEFAQVSPIVTEAVKTIATSSL